MMRRWGAGLRALVRPVPFVLMTLLPGTALAEGRAIIVLDASGSMWDELGGRPKVDIAREALHAVLQNVAPDAELGLLAYGHREKGNCNDIELIVPPAKGRAAAISTAAEYLNFTGKTPLTEAVRQAAAALDSTHQPATVILITDGVDNCQGDPCALAAELEDTGANFTAQVVGFGLKPDEAAHVACLASRTGGTYLQADDLETLTRALQDTVLVPVSGQTLPKDPVPDPVPDESPAPAPAPLPVPDPVPVPDPPPVEPAPAPTPAPVASEPNFAPQVLLAAGGTAVDPAAPVSFVLRKAGQMAQVAPIAATANSHVPPGDYVLETRLGAVLVTQPLTIAATGTATPEIILNAAEVTLAPRIAPGAAIEQATEFTVTGVFGDSMALPHPFTTWLAAGEYTLTARLDAVTATLPLTVVAGTPLQQDVFISAAAVVPQVSYAPGQPVNAADLRIDILDAQPAPDGTRALISTQTGAAPSFHLGAGSYVAVARLGLASTETPFSIALVQRTDLPITLNAGVLAVVATGADSITITPPPDIAGNAAVLGSFAADSTQQTLNAGSYQVTASFGGQIARAAILITPGGRADVVLTAP